MCLEWGLIIGISIKFPSLCSCFSGLVHPTSRTIACGRLLLPSAYFLIYTYTQNCASYTPHTCYYSFHIVFILFVQMFLVCFPLCLVGGVLKVVQQLCLPPFYCDMSLGMDFVFLIVVLFSGGTVVSLHSRLKPHFLTVLHLSDLASDSCILSLAVCHRVAVISLHNIMKISWQVVSTLPSLSLFSITVVSCSPNL